MSFLDELRRNTVPKEVAEQREIERKAKSALDRAKRECKKAALSGNHHANFLMWWNTGYEWTYSAYQRKEVEPVAARLKQLLLSEGLYDVSYRIDENYNDVQGANDVRAKFSVSW